MGAISQRSAEFLIRSRLADAEAGNVDALFELGVTYSTGRGGAPVDLIEAHKWFNLAALNGSIRGQESRAEIAEEMSAREIAEAQRQARAWLSAPRGFRVAKSWVFRGGCAASGQGLAAHAAPRLD